MNTPPLLFADFIPGTTLGESIEVYDELKAQRWKSIFGSESQATTQDPSAEEASMAVVNMLRAYLHVVTPRPPGNVHARQQMKIQALPRHGESIHVAVRCANKSIKRDRKHVELTVQGHGAGDRALFEGRLFLIWAA